MHLWIYFFHLCNYMLYNGDRTSLAPTIKANMPINDLNKYVRNENLGSYFYRGS